MLFTVINAVDIDFQLLGGWNAKKRLMSQRGIDMLIGEGLVSGHMGAARRVLGQEGGTCWVPCSPVTLILSGGLTKRRTSCHSHRSFDVLQSSHTHTHTSWSLFLFIMRIGGFVGEPLDKPRSGKKSKIKQDSYNSLRTCGAGVVQFSCLEPEAWQKRVSPMRWHRTSCS